LVSIDAMSAETERVASVGGGGGSCCCEARAVIVLDGAVEVDKYDAVDIEGELTRGRCVESAIDLMWVGRYKW